MMYRMIVPGRLPDLSDSQELYLKSTSCLAVLLAVMVSGCGSSLPEEDVSPARQGLCGYFNQNGYNPDPARISRREPGVWRYSPARIYEVQLASTPEYLPSPNNRLFKARNGQVLLRAGVNAHDYEETYRYQLLVGNDETGRLIVIGEAVIPGGSSAVIEGILKAPDFLRSKHLIAVYQVRENDKWPVFFQEIEVISESGSEPELAQYQGRVETFARDCESYFSTCLGPVGDKYSCNSFPFEPRIIPVKRNERSFSLQISSISNGSKSAGKYRLWVITNDYLVYGPDGAIPVFELPHCSHGRVIFQDLQWPAPASPDRSFRRLIHAIGLAPDRCYWNEEGDGGTPGIETYIPVAYARLE